MFQEIIKLIEKHDSIVIFGHINPDGDCYGSQVALKRGLSLKYPNKKIYITGSGVKSFFDFLMPMDIVPDEVFKHSLAILVDGNDCSRMEDQRVNDCVAFCKIDHHVDTGTFVQGPSVVDETANSTCDVLTGIFIEGDYPVDNIVANALYLGIVTDSGRFQFVTNYAMTFDRAAFLCQNGANPKAINDILNSVNESSLVSKGFVFTHYKKSKEGTLYIIFTKEDLRKIGISANQASGLVNSLSNVKGYPVWASFAEYEDGNVRVELRSNGPAVQPIAVKIGGGGHMYAAGAALAKLNITEVNQVIDMLDKAIIEWRKK